MWNTDTLWFEVAIVSIIFAIGNMVIGHFKERTPKLRRVGNYLLVMLIVCGISITLGRVTAMTILALTLLPVLYVMGITCQLKRV